MFNLFYPQHCQRIIITGILILLSSSSFADKKPYAPENIENVKIVSAEEVIDLILASPDLIVIDSRKKAEYQKGHIEGAVNILNTRLKREDLEAISPD